MKFLTTLAGSLLLFTNSVFASDNGMKENSGYYSQDGEQINSSSILNNGFLDSVEENTKEENAKEETTKFPFWLCYSMAESPSTIVIDEETVTQVEEQPITPVNDEFKLLPLIWNSRAKNIWISEAC